MVKYTIAIVELKKWKYICNNDVMNTERHYNIKFQWKHSDEYLQKYKDFVILKWGFFEWDYCEKKYSDNSRCPREYHCFCQSMTDFLIAEWFKPYLTLFTKREHFFVKWDIPSFFNNIKLWLEKFVRRS